MLIAPAPGLDEAVAAEYDVEVQGVYRVQLMDDHLVAARLDETAGEVGAARVEDQDTAAANAQDSLVTESRSGRWHRRE